MAQDRPSSQSQNQTSQSEQTHQSRQLRLLAQLQKLLKEEYFLLATENDQKISFQKKMQNALFSYYRSTVNLGESVHQTIQQERLRMDRPTASFHVSNDKSIKYQEEKRLLVDQGFGDAYTFVKEVVLTLSKDPAIIAILIQKYQHALSLDSMTSLAKVIISCMFENIVDDDVYHKDLLKVIAFCTGKLIEDKQHPSEVNLQEKSFIQVILGQVAERSDSKQYAKRIIKNTLLQIAKMDHIIQFQGVEEEEKMDPKASIRLQHKDSNKYLVGALKNNAYNLGEKKSKVKQYSESLRAYDQKNRKKMPVKRKYRNCISDQLLQQLGIYQQIVFPYFSLGQTKSAIEEQKISKQLGKMLHRSQSKIQALLHSDVLIVKNIVLIFFNDVFKMLYSMPSIIRISSRILYKFLIHRFTPKQSLSVVADFIINFWMLASLRVDTAVVEANKLSQYLQKNAEHVSLLIKNIVKDNFKDIHPLFLKQFSQLATNLKASITNYIHEVINIDTDNIDALCQEVQSFFNGKQNERKLQSSFKGPQGPNIKSYCVCINMSDLKLLMEMIKGAEKELEEVNDKLVKRIQRIQLMTNGNDIFGDKRDKITGKLYKASKAYALFTELSLPSHLSIDYFQTYNNAFKNNKSKNLLRQVLLSMHDLETYPQFYSSTQIQDFFQSLQLSNQSSALYSIDSIPLQLKLEYLSVLSRKAKLAYVAGELYDETQRRLLQFKTTWGNSKDCYLRAITSINFQTSKLTLKEDFIRDQIKKRKLDDFFDKYEIRLCLTSPKTRQKELILKTNLLKDLTEDYKEKLWLQNQSKCIHTALNLEFIKSLTGEPQRSRVRYQSHINSILKFSEVLCSLPEVKERFTMAEDNMGIKQVFFDFIQYIRDVIKSKESEFGILLENMEWLEENIELKISKKLYDKLYPKHPLYDDIALHLRLKTLDWISFQDLNIHPSLRNDHVWEVAANHLRLIDKLRTAAQKLHCIEQTNKIIFNSYTLMSRDEGAVSAEDIYPLVILVLIRAAPKRLVSSISFIECFASQSKLLSKQGYCFTQLKAAIQFCDTLTSDSVSLMSSKIANHLEFSKKIYDKQVEYGIYFMLSRGRDSPRSDKLKQDRLQEYFKRKEEEVIS